MKYNLHFVIVLIAVLWQQQVQAQQLCNFGARAAGMGQAAVTLQDVWAVSNNVAAMATTKEPQLGVYANNRFGESAFTTVALQAVYPTASYGTYGLSLSRFGDELYSQQHLGAGAAHRIGEFSLGAKVDVWQVQAKEYGSQKAIALSVGVQGQVLPQLYFGAYAFNLNQAKLADFEDERLPTLMKAGLSYRPTARFILAAETEKNIDHDADFKAGAEYEVIADKFSLRSGFNSLSGTLTFGAGFKARHLHADYAFGSTSPLGSSHHLSLSYTLSR